MQDSTLRLTAQSSPRPSFLSSIIPPDSAEANGSQYQSYRAENSS
jgi:hypothetical protein